MSGQPKRKTSFRSVGLHLTARQALVEAKLQMSAVVMQDLSYSQVLEAALKVAADHPEEFRAYVVDPDASRPPGSVTESNGETP